MVSVKMVRYLSLKSLPLKDLEWLHTFYLNIFLKAMECFMCLSKLKLKKG